MTLTLARIPSSKEQLLQNTGDIVLVYINTKEQLNNQENNTNNS
jgi:hypothetical protein